MTTPIVSKTYSGPNAADGLPAVGDDEVWNVVSTDDVDRSREVVVPSGIDCSRYLATNPIVTFDHSDEEKDAFLLPVARSNEIRLSPDGRRLLSRTQFDMGDEFARRVGGQVKRGFLNAWSVRFRPIEFGPPTKAEIAQNPSWARAKTVYRKTELIAFSPVILPDNPYALTIKKALTMSQTPDERPEDVSKKIRERDGKFEVTTEDGGRVLGTHATREDAEAQLRAVEANKAKANPEGEAKPGAESGAEPGAESPEAAPTVSDAHPFPVGAHVKFHKSVGGGCGTIARWHTKGTHAAADKTRLDASHDEPVAEIELHDDAHKGYGETKFYHPGHLGEFGGEAGEEEGEGAESASEPEPKPDAERPKSKAMTESVGAAGGFAAHSEPDADDLGGPPDDDADDRRPRVGHYVKFDTGKYKGVGKVVSVHKGEFVPDVEDDVLGDDGDPGVKVRCYKAMGDGHRETGMHVGCRLSQVAKCDALRPPGGTKSKGHSADVSAAAPTRVYRFTPLTPEEQSRRAAEWLKTTAGQEFIAKRFTDHLRRRRGAIC